jgi:DNA-binding transcriptional MerR regulator
MTEINKHKLYYSIGEVAKYFNVNTSHIRFWEKEFDVLKPKKNKKGNRLFTMQDLENLQRIYQLVKIEGYTLEGAKLQLKQTKLSEKPVLASENELRIRLEQIKENLLQLKELV